MTALEQLSELLDSMPKASPSVSERIGVHLLDALGAWMAGRATEEGARLARLSETLALSPHFSGGLLDRIALASATIRLTEIDDIHMGSCTTPSSVVVPVALYFAAAQPRPTDSRRFSDALLAGYEVMTRLGVAIDGAHVVYRGVWPTYFAAPMGAAAVATRMLNLDAAKTADALGIALGAASGSPGGPSDPSPRWLLLGLAVRAGCSAALAAAKGYACDRRLLEGDWLQRTHGLACDTLALLAPISATGAVSRISIKPYCAAKQCVAAIEAARQIFDQGISPEEIAELRVVVPSAYAPMIGHHRARDGRLARITSAAYNIALAAYERQQLGDVARPDRSDNPHIARFMEHLGVVMDEELSREYPARWPARADATLRNGSAVSSLVLDAPGDPAYPFDGSQVLAKFSRYVDRQIDKLAASCLAAPQDGEALATLCAWAMHN